MSGCAHCSNATSSRPNPWAPWPGSTEAGVTRRSRAARRGTSAAFDTATGAARCWCPPAPSCPRPAKRCSISDYAWSADRAKLLVFTNTHRVWRQQHARRLLGARSAPARRLKKLGGDAPDSIADVRQVLARRHPRRPTCASTTSTSRTCAMGGSARSPRTARPRHQRHVGLGQRGGVRHPRWVPLEPRRPVHRLLAVRHDRRRAISRSSTTPTRSIPRSRSSRIPKPGTTNSAVRVGVVGAHRRPNHAGSTTEGDPRNTTCRGMAWARRATRCACSTSTACRTATTCCSPTPRRDGCARVFRDESDEPGWRRRIRSRLDRRRQGVHLGQRARRLAARRTARRATATAAPVTAATSTSTSASRRSMRPAAGSTSSPRRTTPTQRYLYRSRLDGAARPSALTPADQPGSHAYNICARRPLGVPHLLALRHAAARSISSVCRTTGRAHAGRQRHAPARAGAAAERRRSSSSRSTSATA